MLKKAINGIITEAGILAHSAMSDADIVLTIMTAKGKYTFVTLANLASFRGLFSTLDIQYDAYKHPGKVINAYRNLELVNA